MTMQFIKVEDNDSFYDFIKKSDIYLGTTRISDTSKLDVKSAFPNLKRLEGFKSSNVSEVYSSDGGIYAFYSDPREKLYAFLPRDEQGSLFTQDAVEEIILSQKSIGSYLHTLKKFNTGFYQLKSEFKSV